MGYVTTRPTGSAAFDDGLLTTGGSVWSVLDDADPGNNATYAYNDGVVGTDGDLVTFASPTLPANAVAIYKYLRVRSGMISSPGSATLTVSDLASGNASTLAVTGTTITDRSVYLGALDSFPTSPVFGINITIGTSFLVAAIYELWLDCYYVAQPTVTILEPTVTNINRPTINWGATLDGTGGAATHHEVRIYASPYTGAPTGGTAADSSGTVSGAATSWRGTVGLTNGTYKAYVRVAQTVNGEQHWSAWDEEDFVISVTAAPVPTLSVSDSASDGRIMINIASGGATTDIIQIQRSYDGGTTWEDVRTWDGGGVITGPWTASPDISDYEAPNGVAASYRARAGRLYTDFYAYSAWTATASDTWTSTAYWLKHPYSPSLNAAIVLKASGTISRAGRTATHQPLGDSETMVVTDLPGQATGEFEIFAHTEADRAPLEALLETGDPLLFQSPSAAALEDRWLIPNSWSRERVIDVTGFPREVYTVPWSEVSTPEGDIAV